jgi:hypothetical protein
MKYWLKLIIIANVISIVVANFSYKYKILIEELSEEYMEILLFILKTQSLFKETSMCFFKISYSCWKLQVERLEDFF